MNRPTILITNDDGIFSHGISVLSDIAKDFGNVVVVAPDSPRSGMALAFTNNQAVFYKQLEKSEKYSAYSCSGTPVDCVKLAFDQIMKEQQPTLLLSGINHGSNASSSVFYSGTMGATIEGCIHEVPSIGFSLCDYSENADFSYVKPYIQTIIKQVIIHGLPIGTCLNVNFPTGELSEISVCKQGYGRWINEFDKKIELTGESSYWVSGSYQNLNPNDDETDDHHLEAGKVTIVPTKIDWTDYHFLEDLKKWEFRE